MRRHRLFIVFRVRESGFDVVKAFPNSAEAYQHCDSLERRKQADAKYHYTVRDTIMER